MTRTTPFIKHTVGVPSRSGGQIKFDDVGVCCERLCDIAEGSVNHPSSARFHICISV